MKQKKYKNIEFHSIDQYEDSNIQLIQNKQVFLYHNQNYEAFLQDTFGDILNLKLQSQNELNLDKLWNDEFIDFNAEEEKVKQIQFIENLKITTGQSAMQLNQFLKNIQIYISPEFQALIQIHQRGSTVNRGISNWSINQSQIIDYNLQGTSQEIIDETKTQVAQITQRDLFQESFGNIQLVMNLYDYYEYWNKLNSFQATIQTIWSFFNGS
ncbi:unnamed protein product [Paramecium pentaurelia]|uniref:Uncharacterized protein n=1 Tax=Paramecium pentaurelia TaxID=43138 RepID=A0A8S1YJK9_9CILI|nr:unnamed protein product [Paramecium pentaurelia]